MTQAYPLHWPENWTRSARKEQSRFKSTISAALSNVQSAIRKFGDDSGKKVENIVISSNVTLGQQRPPDPGVAVYFSWDGISTCIAVDRYEKVEDNLQAIYHCIEAERTKLRHGGLNLVRAAFRGYAALPPPDSRHHWSKVLGVQSISSIEEIRAAYLEKSKESHPDNGGSNEKMAEINAAYASAKKERGQ